ncbi:unnamed protein product [Microthlaspi erraticum]|uniref:F-box domain-containing protein n=1 Tax=Microthlaspi erraticum TaxID=1685480 RepID=A0A6D2K2A7_9BRAS|nr:unnamed protein product [Microthlaspi erraticum]
MSDLTSDSKAEILSRVPMTSLTRVRSTCKEWNALSKSWLFGKPGHQFMGFMMDSRVCSLRLDLQGIREDGDSVDILSIKQVSIFDKVEISKVFQCDGLLLCIIKDENSRLLVWNPYLGKTRYVQSRKNLYRQDMYALGYDNNRNHKILRFLDTFSYNVEVIQAYEPFGFEIFNFNSNSWRVLDVTPDFYVPYYQRGVSVKGNTYFFAKEKLKVEGYGFKEMITEIEDFLRHLSETMEIWVTTKIEPGAVSWSMFLKVDIRPLNGLEFDVEAGSFFIDEEKKAAVVFDVDGYEWTPETCRYQTAYVFGQDGYFKAVNIGEAPHLGKHGIYLCPLVCSSYYPSLVQLPDNKENE